MLVRNCTIEDLQKALDEINTWLFEGNIRFKGDPERRGNAIKFGLTVKDSSKLGARRAVGYRAGRKISAACWHVHGHFFDSLFSLNPDAIVRAGSRKITATEGNWVDWNIGSQMFPADYSSACECWDSQGLEHDAEGYYSRGRSVQG